MLNIFFLLINIFITNKIPSNHKKERNTKPKKTLAHIRNLNIHFLNIGNECDPTK